MNTKFSIKANTLFVNTLFIVIMCSLYVSMWSSTVFSKYKNAEDYANYIVPIEQLKQNDSILIVQISLVFAFITIYLLLLLNIKYILFDSKFIIFLFMSICVIYLLIKSSDPLNYIESISQGTIQLGPWTIFGMLMYFVAKNPTNWFNIQKSLKILTILVLISYFYGFYNYLVFYFEFSFNNRVIALKWLWAPVIIMQYLIFYWLGKYEIKKENKIILFGILLIFCQYIMIILTEIRLILVVQTLGLLYYLIKTERISKKVSFFVVSLFISLYFTIYLISLSNFRFIPNNFVFVSFNSFLNRFSADTRSENLLIFITEIKKDFFNYFPLGLGYSLDELFIVDSGVLNTLFLVGLPMFLLFLILVIPPVFKATKSALSIQNTWVYIIACIWLVRFLSSSTTTFSAEFLIFMIMVGRLSYLSENNLLGEKNEKKLN